MMKSTYNKVVDDLFAAGNNIVTTSKIGNFSLIFSSDTFNAKITSIDGVMVAQGSQANPGTTTDPTQTSVYYCCEP